jgi:hypothetical protein
VGTCVGEDQSHDSADDGSVDRAEQPDRLDRPHRIVRSRLAMRGGRVAKRARPLLFDSLPDAALFPKPSTNILGSCQSPGRFKPPAILLFASSAPFFAAAAPLFAVAAERSCCKKPRNQVSYRV